MESKKTVLLRFSSALALLAVTYFPTFKWMVNRWTASESYYSHGFLIPIISIYLIWNKRDTLKKIEFISFPKALMIIAFGLIIHVISAAFRLYFLSGFSFVFVLFGLMLFFFGKNIVKEILFPIFFLTMMIPLPLVLIGNVVVKLKLFVAQAAVVILNFIGFVSSRNGSYITTPHSVLLVGAPCSGLRSIVSLLTLGLIFAYMSKSGYFKKLILLLSAIPIALIANIIRIIILAFANDIYGKEVLSGFFHDFSGFLMFAFALLALSAISSLLDKNKDSRQAQ